MRDFIRLSRLLPLAGILGLALCAGRGVFAADESVMSIPARPLAPDLSAFQGAVNLANPASAPLWQQMGLGWCRHDFGWGTIEPEQDRWDFSKSDQWVRDAHAAGIEILPVLDYTAPWAAADPTKTKGPVRNPADWVDFVAHVAARYTRPPFNLRYFQVWNEPTLKAGFWQGDSNEQWVEQIYIPAARVLHRYGAQVVFGGWPVSDAGGIDAILAHADAWRYTDIIDTHYHEMSVWQSLYDRWIATGKCKGIWQTEIGFCPFPNYYPNAYLRGLYWALTHQWDEPDKYKLFWYALWGAGPDAKSCLSTGGQERVLSAHGQRAAAMAQLLGGGTLEAFTQYRLDYPLPFQLNEDKPTAMGFRVGRDTVIAFILDPPAQAKHPVIGVTLPKWPRRPGTVEWADVEGNLHPLAFEYKNGTLRIQFPAGKLEAAVARDYGHAVRFAIGYLRARD